MIVSLSVQAVANAPEGKEENIAGGVKIRGLGFKAQPPIAIYDGTLGSSSCAFLTSSSG